MKKLLWAVALSTSACWGQIEVRDHATGAKIETPLILPDVAVNDSEDLVVDVVNTGSDAVTVGSASVSGLYFSLCCDAGFVLQAGAAHSLTLHFAPLRTGYLTGALQINDGSIFIFGRSVAAASLFIQTSLGLVQAHSGTPLVVAAGATSGTQLSGLLRNDSDTPVFVNAFGVTGDLSLASPLSLPLQLNPGEQKDILLNVPPFAQQTALSGVVHMDEWVYAITAHVPMPAFHLHGANSVVESGQQTSVSISFDTPPDAALDGKVELSLETTGTTELTDPAVLFTSTGETEASFTSVAGQTTASFGGQTNLTFQTGTTSGTLHIHASWGYSADDLSIFVAPAPVTIESILGKRESDALDVTLTGFDNTRTAGRLSFSFFDSDGAFIGDPVTADFTELFSNYFFENAYDAGGMFQMVAHFPVTGDTSKIRSVQVDVINTSGDAQSGVIQFQ